MERVKNISGCQGFGDGEELIAQRIFRAVKITLYVWYYNDGYVTSYIFSKPIECVNSKRKLWTLGNNDVLVWVHQL